MATKYKVGQIIRYNDTTWECNDPAISNEIDDYTAIIEAIEKDRLIVKVLRVNTKDIKGRWRHTLMRTIGDKVNLHLDTDESFIIISEMSDILYG